MCVLWIQVMSATINSKAVFGNYIVIVRFCSTFVIQYVEKENQACKMRDEKRRILWSTVVDCVQ